ncbi:MAG: SGNH/GDSL hydrolase family protein [Sumerlaeia bacterium]
MLQSKLLSIALVSLALLAGCGGKNHRPNPTPLVPAVQAAKTKAEAEEQIAWRDAATLRLEGKGWQTETPFVRLPDSAQSLVTEKVWVQSRYSAGLAIHFTTNSKTIATKWPGGGQLKNMTAIGVSGLDLYIRNATAPEKSQWSWAGVGKPNTGPTTATLATFPTAEEREFLLFLPLYATCNTLEIGLDPQATLQQPAPNPAKKPIVFYGTSIVQGGCASRTGMAHTALLRRWLNREVINLGFSGAGAMEIEIADLLGELDPAVIVIDTLPNTTTALMGERYIPFINRLRQHHPTVPLVLVGHIMGDKLPDRNNRMEEIIAKLTASGLQNFTYIPGRDLIAGPEEATVDGVHPTDLGFMRMAEVHYRVLKDILK